VPMISALICFYLAINLSVETWIRFVVWMAIGFIIYFGYSRSHSRLETGAAQGPAVSKPSGSD
jgi:basic amino acid/polyamine antiporter, APA family